MFHAQLSRLARRMQGIREQKQAVRYCPVFGEKHGGLPAAVRVATEVNAAAHQRTQHLNCSLETGAIRCGASWRRRPVRTLLAKWEIAAQDGKAGFSEGAGQRCKQFRLTVASSAVRQHQPVAVRLLRNVMEAVEVTSHHFRM